MRELELRSFHLFEPKEITTWSAWLFSRVVIGAVFVLSFAPFVIYYIEH